MLHLYHKTPADLGATWDQVDDAWQAAMLVIQGGYADEQNRKK